MTEALALKYRPKVFSDLIGQRINSIVLQRMVDTDSVPHAVLFSGPSGVGKTSAARVLASSIGANDVVEVDAASNGGVDQIRQLIEVSRYSTGGGTRVLVLDEAHSITRQGFEALLKTLEEPQTNTVFVLVTTEPHKIPSTILSRLVEFQFRSVSDADVLDRIMEVAHFEKIDLDSDLINYLVRRASGNVRTALMSVDQAWRAGVSDLKTYLDLTGDHDPAPELLQACATGDHSKIFSLLDSQLSSVGGPAVITTSLVTALRDLLVLRSGGEVRSTGEDYEIRRLLAMRLESDRVVRAIHIIWDIRTRLRTDDPRSSLEMALVLIADEFTRGLDPVPAARPKPVVDRGTKKMTLADLQREGATVVKTSRSS